MTKMNIGKIAALFVTLALVIGACRKKDTVLQAPDNLVNFETNAQGIGASENSIAVKLKLTRATDRNITVVVNVTEQGVVNTTDYTTTPAVSAATSVGAITVTIPSGNSEASFTVTKVAGALFDGDEKLVFDIYSSSAPVIIGSAKQLTLSFSELVANTSTATLNGGGVNYPNKVFIDLSANRQTAVVRTAWDLGFYGGTDFRVILNSSTAMMAKQINKTDLNQVTSADTVGFSTEVAFSQTAPVASAMAYIDYPTGDLTRTAIAEISATAADNKVYIVNRGTGVGTPAPDRGWKKIRVIRNASGGYTLQYADIAATSYQEVSIAKDANYFFKYISFETGAVNVEPAATKWDFAWTYFSNSTNFGGGEVPYLFQDIILQNRNVEVVRIMTATKTFEAFAEADLAGLTWSTSQVAIGSDWRSGGGPGVSPAVRTDRFYVIKDGDGNYYKVRFTAMLQNGERGYPAYESVLVKKG